MSKKSYGKSATFWVFLPMFLGTELCLWLAILFFTNGTATRLCSFFSILLAFIFALRFFKPNGDILLLCSALLFTVGADIFLVLPKKLEYGFQVAGTSLFCVTQIFYFIYLFKNTESKNMRIAHAIVRASAVVIAEIAVICVLQEDLDFLSVLSLFYVANLAVSVAFAYTQGLKRLPFAIGLTLFLCCDLFVGFSVAIGTYIQVAESSWLYKLVFSDFNFVWFFYLPSQTVLATYLAIQSENA